MKIKKILNILIFLGLLLNTFACCSSFATQDLETKKKQTRAKINHLKWLESLETNKLYKNQQKLENATNSLQQSKTQIISAQKELNGMQAQLDKAAAEYNNLNNILAAHIRKVFKSQRKAFFELLITSEDINMLVDRVYFQKIILRDDYARMAAARSKAQEIAMLKYNIEARKRNLERSVASINTQQTYIQQAIAKNESMINKLRTDRVAYQRAERELAKQSASIGSYINRTAKDKDVQVASGFIKPIQGRITSPFGWRTHPIFNSKSFHSGVDIGGPNLGAIRASNSGKVIYSGWYGGYGKVVIIEEHEINIENKKVTDTDNEIKRLQDAIEKFVEITNQMAEKMDVTVGKKDADILRGHIQMLRDPMIEEQISTLLVAEKITAEMAVDQVLEQTAEMFAQIPDELLQQRATDFRDIKTRMIKILLGIEEVDISQVPANTVLVARDLTPSMTAGINPDNIAGILTEVGRHIQQFLQEQWKFQPYLVSKVFAVLLKMVT